MRSRVVFVLSAASLAVVVACSDETPSAAPSSNVGGGDASTAPAEDAGDSTTTDAADGGKSGPVPTNETSVEATINDVSRTLGRAQFGVTKDPKGDTLYFEAHEGGVEECPEAQTPKRTIIVSGVPKGAPGDTFTKGDGVEVSLIDFAGDQITTPNPIAKSTAATVTIVANSDEKSVEIEVDVTFAEGTARGRIYATYCAAMSE
jgi:hypothetical protein